MADIPANVTTVSDALKGALGDRLKGISAYGPAKRKLLIIVDKVDSAVLDSAATAIADGRKNGVFVLLATAEDISTSADVFPVKYMAMQKTQSLITGEDTLSNLTIHETHLALRVEQELKTAMFRLRQAYVTSKTNTKAATGQLRDVLRSVMPAIELLKEKCPEAKAVDAAPLQRDKPPEDSQVQAVIAKVHEVIGQASGIADAWNAN